MPNYTASQTGSCLGQAEALQLILLLLESYRNRTSVVARDELQDLQALRESPGPPGCVIDRW